MTATRRFYLIDAFAETPFRGNSAGVVLDADELSDEQLQLIAREINASETAFMSRTHDLHRPVRLRWFTPQVEVGFCGHATLAAAHALHASWCSTDSPAPPPAEVVFDTQAGPLRLVPESIPAPHEGVIWWLHMPEPTLKPDNTNPVRTCELLGLTLDDLEPAFPPMRTRDDDVLYFVRSWQTLMELQPRFTELAAWCRRFGIRGLCVATTETLTPSVNVHSRFFAPAVGINEDPVTGSVHGPLAAYLVVNHVVGSAAGKSGLLCVQGRPGDRGGLVRAVVDATGQGYRVTIGGQCFTTISGEIVVPQGG